MDLVTTQRIGKVQRAINSLPNNPDKRIFWVVYNSDMVKYTEDLIASIKGSEYLSKYVTVVAKSDPTKDRTKGTLYFDPGLMDLLGNGNA